jgi:cell division initiation protein
MLTPLEIRKIEFGKKFGGYKSEDVDEVMNVIAGDYDSLYKENIKLKDRLDVLEDLVNKYKAMEDTMRDTLVIAQRAADDLTRGATSKADGIIAQANNEAELIKEGARAAARETLKEKEKTEAEIIAYSIKIDSILDAQKKILAQILNTRSDKDGLRSDTESAED